MTLNFIILVCMLTKMEICMTKTAETNSRMFFEINIGTEMIPIENRLSIPIDLAKQG